MDPRKGKPETSKIIDNSLDFLEPELDPKDSEVKDSPSEVVLVANLFLAIEDLPRGINGPLDEADDGTYKREARLRDWKGYLAIPEKGKEGADNNKNMRSPVREITMRGMTKINACWNQLKDHAKKNNLTVSDIIAKHTTAMSTQKRSDLQALVTTLKKKIDSKRKHHVLTKRLRLLEKTMQGTAQQRKLRKEARQHINNIASALEKGSVQAVTLALTQFGEFINEKSRAQHKDAEFIKKEIAALPLWKKKNLLHPTGTAIMSAMLSFKTVHGESNDKEKQKVADSLSKGVSSFLSLTKQQQPEQPKIYAFSEKTIPKTLTELKKPCIVILGFNTNNEEIKRFMEIDKNGQFCVRQIKHEDQTKFDKLRKNHEKDIETKKSIEEKETLPILLHSELEEGLRPLIESTKKAVIERHSKNIEQYVENVLVVQTANRLKLEKLLGELEDCARQFLDQKERQEALGLVRELRSHTSKYYVNSTIDTQVYSTFKKSCLDSISKVRPDTSEKAKAGFWQNLEKLKLMIQLLMPAKLQTKEIQEKGPGKLSFLSTNKAFLKKVGEVKASIDANVHKPKR